MSSETAEQIWNYMQMNSSQINDLIQRLRTDEKLSANKSAIGALDELERLFHFLKLFRIQDKVVLDLKLARGLDYYTGVIFEAVLTQYQYDPQLDDDQIAIGSVAGGGRYDQLVGKLDPKEKQVPCVGVSIGVERIFAIKEHQLIVRIL